MFLKTRRTFLFLGLMFSGICLLTQFACSSGSCLEVSSVCVGKGDCPSEVSDEGGPCGVACTNATCNQKCRLTSIGPECYCNDGYSLGKDNKTCEAGTEPLLIFSTIEELRAIKLRSRESFLLHKALDKAASVSSDPMESKIYWTEIANKSSVYSSKIDGTGFEVVLGNGFLLVPEGIAVDYIAKNLYLTDSGLCQVLACKLDNSMCHVLHQTDIQKPRAIALDPPQGQLYWSDWGMNTTGIYRSGMDGSFRSTLVSKEIGWPNGIAIDYITNRLFWIDANMHTIEWITLDGKTRQLLVRTSVFHPHSLAVFEDNLFWSDWNTFSLDSCDKFTGNKINILSREYGRHIMGVHVYHHTLAKNSSNPCESKSCSHMSLIAPSDGCSCVCPPGFVLSNNGRTCLIKDRSPMILVNDGTRIYHIMPEAIGRLAITELPSTEIHNIGKLAYDWNSNTLFITDLQQPAIYAINMTNVTKKVLVKDNLVTPEDIAFDYLTGNLHWIDFSKGTAEIVSTETSMTTTVVVDLHEPVAIALEPRLRKMFISSIGGESSITMYDVDGRNSVVLNARVGYALALAVSSSSNLLYWADSREEIIYSIDFLKPRSERKRQMSRVREVTSLAVSEKYLYWTTTEQNCLNLLKHTSPYAHIISLPGKKPENVSWNVMYAESSRILQSLGLGVIFPGKTNVEYQTVKTQSDIWIICIVIPVSLICLIMTLIFLYKRCRKVPQNSVGLNVQFLKL